LVYNRILKPLLFRIDPENAHHITTRLFRMALANFILGPIIKKRFALQDKSLERELWGIRFPNPVGLAAGFDKDGKYFETMSALGFGFIEIGTVTPLAQSGNPKKRLFRLPKDKALINRMGFNNEGVDTMVDRLKRRHDQTLILGGNIGKNKVTPNDKAIYDYEACFNKLYEHVDYFVINVSSPNTPRLRELQEKEPLTQLIGHILSLRDRKEQFKPVLLKIAPDMPESQLLEILEIIKSEGLDGIIASNTTIDRNNLNTEASQVEKIGSGGLSGAPLREKSRNMVRRIRQHMPDLPIIGVGGITTPEDALAMLEAGADLIQVYSGLVYAGPELVKNIKQSILNTHK